MVGSLNTEGKNENCGPELCSFVLPLKLFGCIFFALTAHIASAQSFRIQISPKHSHKLSTIKSGHKRLVKFYKFYKKDSAKSIKKLEKHYSKVLDSTYKAEARNERVSKRLRRKGIFLSDQKLSLVEKIDSEIRQWGEALKDTTSSDSIKIIAKNKIKDLAVQKAKMAPGFQPLMEKYQTNHDSLDWQLLTRHIPGFDSLAEFFDSSPDQLFAAAESEAIKQFQSISGADALTEEFSQAEKIASLTDGYKERYEQYADKEQLRQKGREKAVAEAVDYFAEHAEKLQMSQAKVSKLLSKYRDITNSDDLSNAVKATSMKGKTFWEHLTFGGNFNVLSTDPFSIDFSPQLGYKFTTRLSAGLGMNYRHTFKDSIKHSWYVSPVNTAFKGFVNYDVVKRFFAYAEWERGNISLKSNDKSNRRWKNSYFVGAGKKILIHPKLYLTTTILYNLNNEIRNAVHPRRFQIRIGFQVSELATRKNRIYYNPNR